MTTLREHSPPGWHDVRGDTGELWEVLVTKHSFTRRALRAAAAGGIVVSALAPTAAFAADYPNGGDPPNPTDVAANTASNSSGSSSLPFTGSDAIGMAAIGAGAALAGVVMVRHSRRTRGATA
jgi:hypothetical protein